MEFRIDPEDFLEILNPVVKVTEETTLKFRDNDLHIDAVSAGNISMISLTADESIFNQISTADSEISVNIDTLTDRIELIQNEPVDADERELIISVNEDHRLEITSVAGSMTFHISLLDPDSVHDDPDLPSLDLPGHVTMTAEYLDHTTSIANELDDQIYLSFDTDNENLILYTESDIDEWQSSPGTEHVSILDLDPAPVESIFSITHVQDIVSEIPSEIPVKMDVGDDFPVWFEYDKLDGDIEVNASIAPRIKDT